jgi:hypothetical protein
MEMYSFNGDHVNVPQRNSNDSAAEAAEHRAAIIMAHMPSREAFVADILARLRDELTNERSPLGDLLDRLASAPIRDYADANSVQNMRNPLTLGRAVLSLIIETSLDAYEAATESLGENRF